MYSVLCNMKRVSITFLPSEPVINRREVVKTPSYTSFYYATANSTAYLLALVDHSCYGQTSDGSDSNDITFFLTSPPLYISVGNSQTLNTPFKMWTRTTTLKNNKTQFVTLITPLNKFCTTTVSGTSLNYWYQQQPRKASKVLNTANK